MSITDFLNARISEDEAMARAAVDGPWYVDDEEQTVRAKEYVGEIIFDRSAECRSEWVQNFKPTAEYVARHDPARVLAECKAKRAIVELADDATGLDMSVDHEFRVDVRNETTEPYCGDSILYALAAVYADHEEYQSEWATNQ